MMKQVLAAVAVVAALTPLAVRAQFSKPEDAIKYRQSAFALMGAHFSRMGAMANGRVPFDAKVAGENAAVLVALSKLPGSAFPAGSESGLNTRAKADIWKDNAKFTAVYQNMVAEIGKLPAAASELGTLRPAFGAAAATCKACHDDFRRD